MAFLSLPNRFIIAAKVEIGRGGEQLGSVHPDILASSLSNPLKASLCSLDGLGKAERLSTTKEG